MAQTRTILTGRRDPDLEDDRRSWRGVFHPDSKVLTKRKPKLKESQRLRWKKKARAQRDPKNWYYDKKTKTWKKRRKMKKVLAESALEGSTK